MDSETYKGTLQVFDIQASRYLKVIFLFFFFYQTYVVGTQKNRLNNTYLLSTQNTGDKIISILHVSYRKSDLQFSLVLQAHVLVL